MHFDSSSRGPYHARAMGNPLRDRRTPHEFAASGQVIDLKVKINDFEKLAAIVQGDLETLSPAKIPPGWRDRPVTGRLEFGFADAQQGLPMLEGAVSATIDVVCQRCLGPMELAIAVPLKLLFADDENLVVDAGDFEIWELEEETMRPLDLVEESLIMALPLAALHEGETSCRVRRVDEQVAEDTVRPFAALKAQMDTDN
jgi:uncharacterized protein